MTSTTEGVITESAHDAHTSPEDHAPHAPHSHHSSHGGHGSAPAGGHGGNAHGQQHPLKLYLVVWVLLFVLSTFSYLVDYFNFQGYLRWTLIIAFMLLKAGAIVAVFMHMAWERLALTYAILSPPLALLVFMGAMAFEGDYTNGTREVRFDAPVPIAAPAEHEATAAESAAVAPTEHSSVAAVQHPAPVAAPAPLAVAKPETAAQPVERHAWAPEWLTSAPEKSEAPEGQPHAWAPEWLRSPAEAGAAGSR